MKIAVYTIPYELANEVDKINKLFQAGLQELHIRKPGYSKKQIAAIIKNIDAAYHNQIVIHSHFSLASAFNLKGIHVDSNYFDGFGKFLNAKIYKNEQLRITASVNEIGHLGKLNTRFNAVFLGPLFTKFSEENVRTNFDSFELRSAISNKQTQVYAMGGIELSNYNKIAQFGFEGLVLQASIWKTDNYLNAFNAFSMKTRGQDELENQHQAEVRIA